MKIVFWGSRAGHCHVTSSMLALAGIAATQFGYSCGILQLHHSWTNGLQSAFMDTGLISGDYFQDTGMDALIRTVKTGESDKQQVVNCGFSFLGRKLDLYLPTKADVPESYYRELHEQEVSLLDAMDRSHDLTFVDAGSGSTPYAIKAMEEADIIVICLPASYNGVQEFLTGYSIEANNLFFLFGDYDKHTSMNVRNICKRFKRNNMSMKNSNVILHDVNFSDAMGNASLSRFFLSNKKVTAKSSSYEFMKGLKATFTHLMRHAGYKIANEE